MVSILFVGGTKTRGALEKSHFITSYNVLHQGVGSRPPTFLSTILEDLVVHAGRQKSAENFPHVSIVVLDALNSSIVHTALSISECRRTLLLKKKSTRAVSSVSIESGIDVLSKDYRVCCLYLAFSLLWPKKRLLLCFFIKRFILCVCAHTHECDMAST